MAGSSLLALIDDIATLLDDVAMMSKVAAKKTAGVLGDDLALNAQQVTGIAAERELPVVWAVAKGSFRNKLILVPAALLISLVAPWAITPLLMAGGLFLCFEGVEKLAHKFLHGDEESAEHEKKLEALADPGVDMVAYEQSRIKGAIRTDFILSAEIITITLGTVAAATFLEKVAVLSIIAIVITIGVYGLVASIVKLDDMGLYLSRTSEGESAGMRLRKRFGLWLVAAAPKLMHALSVLGTIAMFLVGGGILVHGLPMLAHSFHPLADAAANVPGVGAVLATLVPMLLDLLTGVLAGVLALLVVEGVQKVRASKGA